MSDHLSLDAVSYIWGSHAEGSASFCRSATFIPDVQPVNLTAEDILRDAIRVYMDAERRVRASFVPNGIDLAGAAARRLRRRGEEQEATSAGEGMAEGAGDCLTLSRRRRRAEAGVGFRA